MFRSWFLSEFFMCSIPQRRCSESKGFLFSINTGKYVSSCWQKQSTLNFPKSYFYFSALYSNSNGKPSNQIRNVVTLLGRKRVYIELESNNSDNVFKNGSSKNFGGHPLNNLKWYGLFKHLFNLICLFRVKI